LLQKCSSHKVENIWLTASGGPFLKRPISSFSKITPAQAVNHPNWSMGQRISIDSATMFNKALEVIEAHHLFGFSHKNIKVAIHPQSLVHGMIELVDGSMQADISRPDMKLPISYALQYPDSNQTRFEKPPFSEARKLEFIPGDDNRYPVFSLGYKAVQKGNGLGAVLNAADEEAVKLFMQKKIKFTDLARLITAASKKSPKFSESKIDDIWEADKWGREFIKSQVKV